jgi:DNA-binding PadR family transcriptional regulator
MSRAEPDLSGGDYAFLGMLATGCDTAYEVKKAMEASISFFWSAAHSQVYQQAARLVRDGYVKEKQERTGRRRNILGLTSKGRRALRAWLPSPAAPAEFRDEMLVKVFFAAEAPDRAGVAEMLAGQRAMYASTIEEFEAIRERLAASDDARARDQLATLELGLRIVHAYLDWFDDSIPRFRS